MSNLDTIAFEVDGRSTLGIRINGDDLLATYKPHIKPDGSAYGDGGKLFVPPDTVLVLPPNNTGLFPLVSGSAAMIGVCGCGEAGCASLWVDVHRAGNVVTWSPTQLQFRWTLAGEWTFDLLQYLEALESAVRQDADTESRARRLARHVRSELRRPEGFVMRTGYDAFDVKGYAENADILLMVATPVGRRQLTVSADDAVDDAEVLRRLHMLTV